MKFAFQFAFFSGLRTPELIALEWNDIDWLNRLIRVSRAVVKKRMKLVAGDCEKINPKACLKFLNSMGKNPSRMPYHIQR